MSLPFVPSPELTLGVELELQLIDPATRDLVPAAPKLFARLDDPRIRPEIFQSMVEVTTGICRSAAEASAELSGALARLRAACAAVGVRLSSSGSHPFSRYLDRAVFPAERYQHLIERNRWIARRLMIFGLHVHIGARDGDHAIQLMNAMLHHLPHLLALSASSPFWQGADTGLASSRITILEASPTAGHPVTFENWAHFEQAYHAMIAADAITGIKDIWWDVRPHPDFGTVEIRIFDMPPTLDEAIALAAMTHALAAWIDAALRAGQRFCAPSPWVLRENKWRASRHALEARFVLDDEGRTLAAREGLAALLAILEPFAEAQGAAREFAHLHTMLAGPPSFVRQRAVFAQRHELADVVDALVDTFAGTPVA